MSTLPLSRRSRLHVMLVLGPLTMLGTGLITATLPIFQSLRLERMSEGAPYTPHDARGYYESPTRVPLSFWATAPDYGALRIIAPWGEWVTPYSTTVLGMRLYNPFTTRRTSSPRFVAWQFARASTAVHDTAYALASYRRLESTPRVTRQPRMIWLQAGVGAAVLLLFTSFAMLSQIVFHRMRSRWRWPLGLLSLLMPLSLMIGELALRDNELGGEVMLPLVQRELLRLSAALPDALPLVAIVSLLPLIPFYLLAYWLFSRTEIDRTALAMTKYRE